MSGPRDFFQSMSNSVASNVSAPVDGLAWLLKKAGVPVGTPVGGSDWMAEKGLTAPVKQGAYQVAGETAGLLSPMAFSKSGLQAMIDAVKATKNMPVGLSINNVAPQAEALALAQQRAALPVEKGGLGLLADNTPMDRAKAMGYQEAYHGTNADIKKFDLGRSGQASGAEQHGVGVYTATNPHIASGYANPTREGANVMPLMVRMENSLNDASTKPLTRQQIAKILSKSPELDDVLWNFGDVGRDGASKVLNKAADSINKFQNEKTIDTLGVIGNDFYPNNPIELNNALASILKKDGVQVDLPNAGDGKFLIPWNVDQIRSRFAAFDPFRKSAAIAAAMGVAAPDLLAREREGR